MNFLGIFLTAFISFCYHSVSAASSGNADGSSILRTIVCNLPPACKQLNNMGTFDALSSKSYECLFEEGFDVNKSATIISLLMQRGNDKLVEEIAEIWVSKRQWGPFNQSEIVKELYAVLTVKQTAKIGGDKVKVEINLKSIYAAFKVLLQSGKDLIVADAIYENVVVKALNLAHKIDKEEKEFAATASIILEHFYSMKEEKDIKTVDGKSDIYKRMAQANYVTRSLNSLAKKEKIKIEAWEVYGPVICKILNEICGTDFAMVDHPVEQKKRKDSTSSSESESESSDRKTQSKTVSAKSIKPKVMKLIEISSKFASSLSNEPAAKSAIKLHASNSKMEYGTGFWLIASGSASIIAIIAYFIYQNYSKNRGNVEFSDL